MAETKRVKCCSTSCPHRRRHHDYPGEERGEQWFDVPADHPGPWFCSVECSVYGKYEAKKTTATDMADAAKWIDDFLHGY